MVLTKRDSVLNSHTHLFAAIVVGSNEVSSEEASQLPQKRYQLPNICHNGTSLLGAVEKLEVQFFRIQDLLDLTQTPCFTHFTISKINRELNRFTDKYRNSRDRVVTLAV